MKPDASDSSPAHSVIEALTALQDEFRSALQIYSTRLEQDIAKVQEAVASEASKKKFAEAKLRDLRDMLTLLRKSPAKAGKGRRKDLKKFDALVEDLTMLVEHW